ncbi:hypothetical protein, partial [Kineococcus sp. G2]|uniref:hypothetical protein n=1 Tax=Kineococcus sp. G2 TaxID=3127484 RepID=UPI00301CFF4D
MRRNVHRDGDEGYALAFVMITMMVVAIVVATTITIAMSNLKPSRENADSQAALAAAQTGVDDFVTRLNACDAYWRDARDEELRAVTGQSFARACPGSTDSPALLSWASVPGTDGSGRAKFTYDVLSAPDGTATPGRIRLRSTGDVGGQQRTVTIELSKQGFLQYIYYTEREAPSPSTMRSRFGARVVPLTEDFARNRVCLASSWWGGCTEWGTKIEYGGLSVADAERCSRTWYDDRSGNGRRARYDSSTSFEEAPFVETYLIYTNRSNVYSGTAQRSCDIQFGPQDVISGRLYSKDALMLGGSAASKPTFIGSAQTYWQPSYSPAPRANAPWRDAPGNSYSGYNQNGQKPAVTQEDVSLPPSNGEIRAVASGATGCLYTGPTRIVFQAGGGYTVTSPRTTTSSSACGSNLSSGAAQTVSGPSSGVIYVDAFSGQCTDPASGGPRVLGTYPVQGDVTTYSCTAGDVFVEGRVKGRYTIASADRVVITGNTTYVSGRSTTGTDVLGLIAGTGNVEIYHPVRCATTVVGRSCVNDASDFGADTASVYANLPGAVQNIEVHAALLSVSNSFTVQNYDRGAALGTLSVFGGIYQKQRGAVALSG